MVDVVLVILRVDIVCVCDVASVFTTKMAIMRMISLSRCGFIAIFDIRKISVAKMKYDVRCKK